MIRVEKGAPPRNLAKRASAGHAIHAAQYLADGADYRSGKKSFKPDSTIYGAKAVKTKLRQAHSGKCVYCEEKLDKRTTHGHVEHFRPIAFSKASAGTVEIRPGYYWLAYAWENFLWSCHYCNSTRKGNLFPLADEMVRARLPSDDLALEEPMLVKPDKEDPSLHIGWYKEVPMGLTERGRITIEVLGLDLPVHETRLSHYRRLEQAHAIVSDLTGSPDANAHRHVVSFRAFLLGCCTADQPFSAMATAFLRDNPLP
ncbi:hypothetical protein ASE85_18280 [Sphingobium sp. Leaf26]|uniref:hypothetical protein n=1 Tax=Sphingobium sp. Leaf26 TaxID=1735693 RepID=UPI0006F5A9E6|nr:hypothetical protein [Sphingobium sp. Leaf26]KQN07543.1 hypothetical protein ASE85_18280 [Sphingobium sp. Leaf26]